MSSAATSVITADHTNIIDATHWFCLHSSETYESYYGWHCTRCDALLYAYGCEPWLDLDADEYPCDGTLSELEYLQSLPDEAFFEFDTTDCL